MTRNARQQSLIPAPSAPLHVEDTEPLLFLASAHRFRFFRCRFHSVDDFFTSYVAELTNRSKRAGGERKQSENDLFDLSQFPCNQTLS
jgi:hypothetical protein